MSRRFAGQLLAALIVAVPAFSQIDTLAALSAFPLQQGNRWQYEVMVHPYQGLPYFAGHHEISIGEEVLAPNGEQYIELLGLNLLGGSFYVGAVSWVRLDSTGLAVMQYVEDDYFDCANSEERLLDLSIDEEHVEYETCVRQVEAGSSDMTLPGWGYESIGLGYFFPWTHDVSLMQGLGLVGAGFGDLGFSSLSVNYARVNGETWGDWVGVAEGLRDQPSGFSLQAWPNPFNPQARIRYELAQPAEVELAVHDLLGRQVAVLAEGPQASGWHEATLDGSALCSGMYVVSLAAAGHVETRKLLLVR